MPYWTDMSKKLVYILAGIGLFLFSIGVSYLAFSYVKIPSLAPKKVAEITPTPGKKSRIDPSIPRTEVCPLNGVMYTQQEKALWDTRRPLAVMIENHADSRPLSGLTAADIVYEAVAEGGITRHMAVFYCNVMENTMFAPVRSARIYFTKLVQEYDALYNHVGGAGNCDDPTVDERAKALCFIRKNKIKDLDQFGRAGDFKTCHRVSNRLDREVAYEHTMACFSDELYKAGVKYDWTNVDEKGIAWDKNFKSWKFKDEAVEKGAVVDISFDFWANKNDYSVAWKYDPATNSYLRENGGQKVMDLNVNEQVAAKVLIVQFVKETGPLDEHFHMYYEIQGTGKTLVFQDGTVTTGTWSKPTLVGRTKFTDSKGKEIEFNRGQVWIELVPADNVINYIQ